MTTIINFLISTLSLSYVFFHIYIAATSPLPTLIQRPIHLGFAISLSLLLKPISDKKKNYRVIDIILVLLVIVSTMYLITQYDRLESRYSFVDEVTVLDQIAGSIIIICILEGTRRLIGKALVILSSFFIFYMFLGPYFPGLLRHGGVRFSEAIDLQFLTINGIFGTAIGVSVDYIFYFIVFASILSASGATDVLMDIIKSIKSLRKSKFGPAMMAVLSSSLMGSISGSATANVAATGAVTIPLMKRIGYSPIIAASIEAVASTGGQFMPPIMGASIFIMAEMLGRSYWSIAKVAFIPAIIYYIMVAIEVYVISTTIDIKGQIDLDIAPEKGSILPRLSLFIPIIYLVYCIMSGYSLMLSTFRAIIILLIISFIIKKRTLITFNKIIDALKDSARTATNLAIVCGASGIIVGSALNSGLNLRFPSLLVDLSGDNLVVLLTLSAIGLIIMGMGLPTVGAYIMGAIIFVPAIRHFGVNPLAAHFFVFYFGVTGLITPPVAVTSYAGASIAGSDFMKTGYKAFQLSAVAFLIPYTFVHHPALLLQGSGMEIIIAITIAFFSSMFFAIGMTGLLIPKSKIKLFIRILFVSGGFFIVVNYHYYLSIFVGLMLFLILFFYKRKDLFKIAINKI